MTNEQREIHRKKRIIEYAERTGAFILHVTADLSSALSATGRQPAVG